ncbi:MAG TPA: PaaI family thioesterase [Candidatus Edwardsbacteria bacterium]|nr:PaaI family thioesterase [Candidatus Edwardsbacteria bacterium]
MTELSLNDDHFCFVCGSNNPDGLRLTFQYPAPGTCRAEFTPPRKFQGWQGILHGGIVSTLLDEALAHAAGGAERGGGGSGAVTAEITVRFKRPVPIGQMVLLEGRVISDKGRVVECESFLKDSDGNELATAKGKLVRPRA